jgi:hypothetical protein
VVCYSIAYLNSSFKASTNDYLWTQVLADRALTQRIALIETFSEDGLPFDGIDMRSQNHDELFKLYQDDAKPLELTELVHLKLIA